MNEIINGDYLAKSLALIILRRQLKDIREMMKDRWDEVEKESINIPQWQRQIQETFDFRFSQFLQRVKDQGRFIELANEAANHCFYKRMLDMKANY